MRTAALTLTFLLLAFSVAPAAFAESSQDASSLNAVYYVKDGKHFVDVTLEGAEKPQGNWIITLNGSNEITSPEGVQTETFTAKYDDLQVGKSYQLIAVFYGKDGSQPVDVNRCYQLNAKDPQQSTGEKVELKDCGFQETVEKLKNSDTVDKEDEVTDSVNPSNEEKASDNENKQEAPQQEEESSTLFHRNSGNKADGGPMPDTSFPYSLSMIGSQLLLLGCALLGFRRN